MIALWSVGYDVCSLFFFFKQKTAYEMRISDWSSDVLFRSKPLQRQFEADGEQQEDDAEMRQRLDRRIVAEEAQRIGTDKHAGDQVPDHRAGAQPMEHRHDENRRGQQNQDIDKEIGRSTRLNSSH